MSRLPVSMCAWADGDPPLRVMTLITPAMASDPYSALCGPRTTSIRSTSCSGTCDKSRPPPKALARMPSIITSVKSDSPPRVKSDVTVPGPPFCCSGQAGHRSQRRREHELLLGFDLGAGDHGDAVGGARQRLIDLRRRDDERFGDRADVKRDVERRRRGGDVDRHRVAGESGRARGDAIRGPASSSAKTNLPSLSARARSGVAAAPVTITSALATGRPSGSVTRPLRLAALGLRRK